jgi:sterol desaturase/sphingolipid hydroxylase (fatty acid hydroxylase superfamily)
MEQMKFINETSENMEDQNAQNARPSYDWTKPDLEKIEAEKLKIAQRKKEINRKKTIKLIIMLICLIIGITLIAIILIPVINGISTSVGNVAFDINSDVLNISINPGNKQGFTNLIEVLLIFPLIILIIYVLAKIFNSK